MMKATQMDMHKERKMGKEDTLTVMDMMILMITIIIMKLDTVKGMKMDMMTAILLDIHSMKMRKMMNSSMKM
ncbi:MAG: hypothetical protein HDS85_03870 [Bacteroidales bacterium]|nr:hypothetical protein [Bacteroidales bacterium]